MKIPTLKEFILKVSHAPDEVIGEWWDDFYNWEVDPDPMERDERLIMIYDKIYGPRHRIKGLSDE